MNINMDPKLSQKLDQGMRNGEAVELPFPVLYAWTQNGQPTYKSQGGALYYGGWACKRENMEALIAQAPGSHQPAGWQAATIATRDGSEFEALVTRSIFVAPIARRESWLLDNRRLVSYTEGARHHIQVLAIMAEALKENGQSVYRPWGPVVLTAKGYQVRNLTDAFSNWNKATAALRRKVAGGVPAWCFYLALGTFGKDRKAMNVGKAGAQSPITPIGAFIPEKIEESVLQALFVGNETAAAMANFLDLAAEWLKAWSVGSLAQSAEELPDDFMGSDSYRPDLPDTQIPF